MTQVAQCSAAKPRNQSNKHARLASMHPRFPTHHTCVSRCCAIARALNMPCWLSALHTQLLTSWLASGTSSCGAAAISQAQPIVTRRMELGVRLCGGRGGR